MSNLYVIILAGGASSRFWPLSGDEFPKYLLQPTGDETLLTLAWDRAVSCTDAARVIVVTTQPQADVLREALPELQPENLCIEPARRDTAAAITLGCKRVFALDPDADVLVMPADTLLEPANALADGVAAARAIEDYRDAIHVFGVSPSRAEGGFGYIKPGDDVSANVMKAGGFVEKPGADKAAEFSDAGYLWNIGCFFFALPTFDRELGTHMPAHSSRLRPVVAESPTEADYEKLESISIDFGLIEKVENLRAVKLDAQFDDIGTWDALVARLESAGKDPHAAKTVAGKNNFVIGEGLEVAVVGESNLLVIHHHGKVLVLKRGHGQEVKKLQD